MLKWIFKNIYQISSLLIENEPSWDAKWILIHHLLIIQTLGKSHLTRAVHSWHQLVLVVFTNYPDKRNPSGPSSPCLICMNTAFWAKHHCRHRTIFTHKDSCAAIGVKFWLTLLIQWVPLLWTAKIENPTPLMCRSLIGGTKHIWQTQNLKNSRNVVKPKLLILG